MRFMRGASGGGGVRAAGGAKRGANAPSGGQPSKLGTAAKFARHRGAAQGNSQPKIAKGQQRRLRKTWERLLAFRGR